MVDDDGKLVVEISLGRDIWLDHGDDRGRSFGEYVAERAAQVLVGQATKEDYYGQLKTRAENITDEEMRAAIKPLIEDAIAKVVQPTNGLGEPTGERRTLGELISKKVQAELKVTAERDGFSRGRSSLLEHVIQEQVRRELRGDLQKAVDEAKQQVLAVVRAEAAQVLADTIQRAAPRL